MKKMYNFLGRILLIIFSVFAYVPALIILIISDIREERRIRHSLENNNLVKFSHKKGTKSKPTISASYQFVSDSV